MDDQNYIIGTHHGETPGPLFVCVGGMHGNESAGVKAIELLLKMIEVEPITNPDFKFRGHFLGLLGNPKAYARNVRYIERDMNRCWKQELIDTSRIEEVKSIRSLLRIINTYIDQYQPEEVFFLDLHTTSSDGGIFSIVTDELSSIELARGINAPIIKGFIHEIKGTSIQYVNSKSLGINTTSLVFESGQHTDPLSVNRSIAALICCLRNARCINTQDVENRHIEILKEYARDLPEVTQLLYRHQVSETDQFEMFPGYKNFQMIQEGEPLAKDRHGTVVSPYPGLILLPLYQKQGSDGFFIIKQLTHEEIYRPTN